MFGFFCSMLFAVGMCLILEGVGVGISPGTVVVITFVSGALGFIAEGLTER